MSAPTQVPIWDTNGTKAVEPTDSQKTDGINVTVFDGDLYKSLNWQLKLIGDWFSFINAGVTGSFIAGDKTITVTKGIITSIVDTPP
jgi:hypothetical protein